jgi:hypothetical protein
MQAFVDYFLAQLSDSRTPEELKEVVNGLLKGCLFHYNKSVTQLAKAEKIIPSQDCSEFRNRCKDLLTADEDEFFEIIESIRSTWPHLKSWLNWWLIPENAQMLFSCMHKMTPELTLKLPDTSNAEESMHSSMNRIVGKHNSFYDGINGLLAFAKYYQQQTEARQCK